MALRGSRFKGRVKIRGRPMEQAQAEIALMKHQEGYDNRKRRRAFFTFLDILAGIGFLGGVYSFYIQNYVLGSALIGIGIIILAYFLIRYNLRNKGRRR